MAMATCSPIVFVVVEAETRESWQWFMTILLEDLSGVADRLGWAIMSDRQKVFDLINYLYS
jgi:hypothetical protein